MIDDLVRTHIRAVLQAEGDYEKRKEALLADYEAQGHLITDGGQTDHDSWEITDYRTGKLIAKGDGGFDEYCAFINKHGESWVHIDPITEDLDLPDPVTEGLPESLCEALDHWVREQADDEDIAMVLGEE
jgi:hypothetical protein